MFEKIFSRVLRSRTGRKKIIIIKSFQSPIGIQYFHKNGMLFLDQKTSRHQQPPPPPLFAATIWQSPATPRYCCCPQSRIFLKIYTIFRKYQCQPNMKFAIFLKIQFAFKTHLNVISQKTIPKNSSIPNNKNSFRLPNASIMLCWQVDQGKQENRINHYFISQPK